MKIATWNINSIRKRIKQIQKWIIQNDIDIICLQETKVIDEKFPIDEIKWAGYNAVFDGQQQYNGVAVLYKTPIENVSFKIDNLDDTQARFIKFSVKDITVYSGYFPNGTEVGSERFQYKLDFFDAVLNMIKSNHKPQDKVMVIGDINVAPSEIDLYDPDKFYGNIAFHPDELAKLQEYYDWGFEDLFRIFHPAMSEVYSWWDYRKGGFPRNNGLRIDLLLTTKNLTDIATNCYIDSEPRGWHRPSDHAPVIGEFII